MSGLITGNGEDDKNKLQVEKELLEVIDELYRSVVVIVIFIDELYTSARPVCIVVTAKLSMLNCCCLRANCVSDRIRAPNINPRSP